MTRLECSHSRLTAGDVFSKALSPRVSRQRIYYILPKFICKCGSSVRLALCSSLSCWNLFFMSRQSILRRWGQLSPASWPHSIAMCLAWESWVIVKLGQVIVFLFPHGYSKHRILSSKQINTLIVHVIDCNRDLLWQYLNDRTVSEHRGYFNQN